MPPATLPLPADVAARSLYLYANEGAAGGAAGGHAPGPADVVHRGLYLYVNESTYGWPVGGEPLDQDDVLARVLYLMVNEGLALTPEDVAARALYDYESYTSTEPFPWLEKIVPNEQFASGQVDLYGDGFGATQAAEGGQVKLGAELMGVVSWSARSPGLHPGPGTTDKAITATVPADAASGLLTVELTS